MHDLGWSGEDLRYAALAVTVIAGLLMVSGFRYSSFKGGKPGAQSDRIRFFTLFAIVIAIIGLVIDPPKVLLFVFATFAVFGPLISRRMARKSLADEA